MNDCCEVTADLAGRQRLVLQIVLWLNVAMFLTEATAGVLAHSTALLADSADMAGDALVYGFSLYVVARGAVWKGRAALLKGVVMAAFGAGVLVEVTLKVATGAIPVAGTMGMIGALALAANLTCLAFLWPRRRDDVNMRSAWTCSRNDVVANGGVLLAGVAVALTGQAWPDITVGLVIAGLFLASAVSVIGAARRQLVEATAELRHAGRRR